MTSVYVRGGQDAIHFTEPISCPRVLALLDELNCGSYFTSEFVHVIDHVMILQGYDASHDPSRGAW